MNKTILFTVIACATFTACTNDLMDAYNVQQTSKESQEELT